MKRLRVPLLVLMAGFVLVMTACGSSGASAATVGSKKISQGSLEGELRDIASNDKYLKQIQSQVQMKSTGVFDSAFTAQVLSRQIVYELVKEDLARRKVQVTPADRDAARAATIRRIGGDDIFKAFPKSYQDTLVERSAEVNTLAFQLLDQGPPDKVAAAYYDAHKDEFAQACVSHILLSTPEEAAQAKARLDGGEDFATVAKAVSKDTGSAPMGGDLGCVGKDNQLVPEFAQAMFSQPVGQVGAPVKTQFGYHLILVRSRDAPPYAQVAGQVREKAVSASQEKLSSWLDEVVNKTKVVVNPQYGQWDQKGAQSQVVPPQAPGGGGTQPATTGSGQPSGRPSGTP